MRYYSSLIPIHYTLFNLLVILWFILSNYRYYCNRSFKENVNRAHALAQAHRRFLGETIKHGEKYVFHYCYKTLLQGKSSNDVEDVRDRDTWVTKEGKTCTPITGYSRC